MAALRMRAYEQAATYLCLMEKVYARHHRLGEWQGLLEGLRKKHKAERDSSKYSIIY